MNIDFDENGYLLGEKPIHFNLLLFETIFVESFPKVSTRRLLFDNYIEYIQLFSKEIFPYFEQWINGSFITQKIFPKDIDFVTFLDYKIFEYKEKVLENYWSFALEEEGLDAYIVKVYPKNHPKYATYLEQRNLWLNRFNSDRKGTSKGFIQLNFEKSTL